MFVFAHMFVCVCVFVFVCVCECVCVLVCVCVSVVVSIWDSCVSYCCLVVNVWLILFLMLVLTVLYMLVYDNFQCVTVVWCFCLTLLCYSYCGVVFSVWGFYVGLSGAVVVYGTCMCGIVVNYSY